MKNQTKAHLSCILTRRHEHELIGGNVASCFGFRCFRRWYQPSNWTDSSKMSPTFPFKTYQHTPEPQRDWVRFPEYVRNMASCWFCLACWVVEEIFNPPFVGSYHLYTSYQIQGIHCCGHGTSPSFPMMHANKKCLPWSQEGKHSRMKQWTVILPPRSLT